jgi:hypothetical protein
MYLELTRKQEEDKLKKRKEMNEDIIRRLKAGEALQDRASLTWFPPRPLIEKDKDEIKNLYGSDVKVVGSKTNLKTVE